MRKITILSLIGVTFLLNISAFGTSLRFEDCRSPEASEYMGDILIQNFEYTTEYLFKAKIILPFSREIGSLFCGISDERNIIVACSGSVGRGTNERHVRVRIYDTLGDSDLGVIGFGSDKYSIEEVLPLMCEQY